MTHPSSLPGNNHARNKRARDKKLLRNRKFLDANRKTVCEVCGYSNPEKPWHFDYHHKDPSTKRWGIRSLMNLPKSIAQIKEEIAKCSVVCKLCHADIVKAIMVERKKKN